ADGLKGEICLDVVKRLQEDTVISQIDWFPVIRTRPAVKNWTSYLMRQRQELELKKRVVGLLDLNSDWTKTEVKEAEGFIGSVENSMKEDLFKRAEEKLASICSERVRLEDLLRKANSNYHGDGKFVELQEKYVQVFKDLISFDVGMNSVNGDDGDGHGDDDGTRDDDVRGDSEVNRDDDNADSRNDDDVEGDGNGNEDDAGNGDDEDGGCKSIEKQVDATTKEVDATTKEVDATTKENVVEESDEITCTPESFSQWIDANSDFVLEQIDCVVDEYLYGDALDAVAEDMRRNNEGTVTPERLVTRHSKASPSPNKRMVKPSSYLLSPYMNKKTKVLPKINRSEFMIGTSLFAMQRDKIETVFETTSGEEKVFGIRLNMETLSPGLCIDANVVDCWAEILNYEDRFRKDGSLSRHFFPTGCITKSMFDGTLSTYEEKWKSFAAEVSAQFKDNVGGLALSGIDLAFFPICFSGHFYVVVFSITNTTSMTILDNMDSGATYDSKYKQPCDLLKKLFASHLRLYGHERHSKIGRLKARIPKLKWKTKANVKDCGIFTMLHMESYMGQTAKTWDCGLVAESKQQCDMLRQLRFKFATKILLHEINVHAQKMIRYAEEFDKIVGFQKMCIVVDALKNREEREKN
ncbi:ulp1 protease family, C-terminal catalytic domain-containing protein, partial [Tanacetum coccineum]